MSLTPILCALLALVGQQLTHAQFKTAGIKTRYPPQQINQQQQQEEQHEFYTGNLVMQNSTQGFGYNHSEQHNYDGRYNGQAIYPSQPSSASQGFDYNHTQQHNYDGRYHGQSNYPSQPNYASFVPAENFQPGDPIHVPMPTRPPVPLDATAEFINKTRAGMASGICYKEVPTSSLHHGPSTSVPAGNGTSPGMSKIQVCCEGYERNAHVFRRCDPVCQDNCPNGICTAPNTCVCIPGHIRNEQGKCISTCPLGCGNGICNDNGECQCRPGYTLEPEHKKYCVPLCEPACEFGKCVAPNKCDCLDGYRLTGSGMCEPKCDNCDNGRCSSPGFCSCYDGYAKLGEGLSATCEPICSKACNNGFCIAPEKCGCRKGYELDASEQNCVPHCEQPCTNGICTGENICQCNFGYVQDEQQRNVCKAHCPQGCPNGYCTAPNFCTCQPGFIKSGIKGRQSCMPV